MGEDQIIKDEDTPKVQSEASEEIFKEQREGNFKGAPINLCLDDKIAEAHLTSRKLYYHASEVRKSYKHK